MKEIKLLYPIPIPDTEGKLIEVRVLKLGRLKAKHFKDLPASMFDDGGKSVKPAEMIPLIAVLANVPEDSIEELDMVDMMVVIKELGSFLEQSLQTGNN